MGRRPDGPLRGLRAVLRFATVDDAKLLSDWHADREIARFWDGEMHTSEAVIHRLARPHVDAYIVEFEGSPIGYLQAWFGETSDVGGLDMFLVPSARGQGLGPDAARTLARYLIEEGGRTRVTVDPYLWNEQGIRGWRNAGFRPVAERDADAEHTDRWLLMEFVSSAGA